MCKRKFTGEGRRLTEAEVGSDTVSYTYNIDGIRTSKTIGSETTEYFLEGSTVIAQKTGNNVLWFLYDADGQRIGFTYNDTPYLYVYNATGDVVGIVDDTLTMVVEYTYSPWGEILSTTGDEADTIGVINPFRYRGYYYDEETGLYCLNSRYYDPETGRFINADTTDILTASPTSSGYDKNLYAYCDNDPISRADNSGEFWHIVAGAVAGGLISGVTSVLSQAILNKGNINWQEVGTATLAGMASGALAATGVGLAGQIFGNVAISMANSAADQIIENQGFNNFSTGKMIIDGVIGGVSGKMGGAGVGNIKLDDAAKLMNKNAIEALRNGTKNGVRGAIKFYASSRPVQRYYSSLLKDSKKQFIAGLRQNAIAEAVGRLFPC